MTLEYRPDVSSLNDERERALALTHQIDVIVDYSTSIMITVKNLCTQEGDNENKGFDVVKSEEA